MWLLLFACQTDPVCTKGSQPSILLNFVDGGGAQAIPEKIEWYHNDAAMGEISQLQSTVKIGSELAGDFDVIVTAGGQVQNFSYTVRTDECGVIPVADEIQILSAVDCDDLELPSVIVSAQSADAQPLIMEEVIYTVDGGAEQDAVCFGDCGEWIAATEVVGDFTITGRYLDVSTGNILEESTAVVVVADECNVITQEVVLDFAVNILDQDCDDSVDEGWMNYFDNQIGCGDVSMFSTIEGGFQQLHLELPEILGSVEQNESTTLSLADSAAELSLQFGQDLDQYACSGEVEPSNVTLEYSAVSGTVTVYVQVGFDQSYEVSATVEDVIMQGTDGCSISLDEYSWNLLSISQ